MLVLLSSRAWATTSSSSSSSRHRDGAGRDDARDASTAAEFARWDDPDPLRHLTNGLLNQRLNPEYDDRAHVWESARLLPHLEALGVPWAPIEAQVRAAIATAMISVARGLRAALTDAAAGSPAARGGALFAHWRFDFLLDDADPPRAWLLECEIVPSTGTIGGPDEVTE